MEIRKQPDISNEVEIRSFNMVTRSENDVVDRNIEGHAALFNDITEIYPGFKEQIAPGAFANALPKSDIRLLLNHNADVVLGRMAPGRSSNTLTVFEDKIGLPFKCELPESRTDLIESLKRKDIDQCSFAFRIKTSEWDDLPDGSVLRTIVEVEEILDVSIVTYPAYKKTTVGVVAKSSIDEFERRSAARQAPTTPPATDSKSKYKLRRRALALNSK